MSHDVFQETRILSFVKDHSNESFFFLCSLEHVRLNKGCKVYIEIIRTDSTLKLESFLEKNDLFRHNNLLKPKLRYFQKSFPQKTKMITRFFLRLDFEKICINRSGLLSHKTLLIGSMLCIIL